ncbi:MAG: maleylpyruvate isomerase family mycothiol-dependent enzyme [Chloroflexota bacterium]
MDENLCLFVRERLELCDLLAGLSDEEWSAASLDAGWTVEDVAAHIVVRERRSLDMVRALLFKGKFGPDQDELLKREKRLGRPALVAALRTMPPLFFRLPGPAALGNLAEAFIHHEDIRRGALDRPRPIPLDLQRALWTTLPFFSGRGLRRVPVKGTLAIVWPDHDRRTASVGGRRRPDSDGADAVLSGEPGELLLWLSGRKTVARVRLDGVPALVAALREAPMRV